MGVMAMGVGLMRVPTWPEILAAYAEEVRGERLDYGEMDCVLLAAGWLRRVTGRDVLADLEGWTDGVSARLALARVGGDLLAAAGDVLAARGCPAIEPRRARRGDVIGLDADGEWGGALGVCLGGDALAIVDGRVDVVPMAWAVRAWRVG